MATRLPVDLIVGTTPAAGVSVRCPENAQRIRAYNFTNQWVHITSPIDQFVAPGQTGASYVIVLPTAGFLTLTALFEAPGGWTQAGSIANQKCTLTVESDDSPFPGGDYAGVLAVTPNVYAEHFEDDCDPAHPYTARFYIPTSIQLAKAITLSYLAAAYRYYVSTATGGAGGGTTQSTTSQAAGATDSQLNLSSGLHQHTQTDTASPGSTTDSTGSSAHTTDAQGVHNHGTNAVEDNSTFRHDHATGVFAFFDTTHSHLSTNDGSHSHNVNTHTHSHSHTVSHNHSMTGQPADGAHTHPHSHTVTVTHAHNVTLPDHTHPITVNPGVVEELTANSWTLAVDGNAVPAPPLNATDLNIVPYVTKDANGNPATGWHTIRWTPNQRSRVLAELVVQIYLAAF